MDPETKIMEHPVPAKHKDVETMPYRKTKVKNGINHMLHLPGGQRIISCSWDGSFRVWDLEKGTQVEEWEDKDEQVSAIALSPGGKTLATGSYDGVVKLWDVNTAKVIKTLLGHTKEAQSLCWSPDGKRVVSGCEDGAFRVWDVESGETIIGPIKAGEYMWAVCYSPDAKMIATGGVDLNIWDANTGKLLKTFEGFFGCLAWTSDGKTLFADESKIDTATWTVLDVRDNLVDIISLSPNERILASTSDETVQLWNLETNQPIGTPLLHQSNVNSAIFSADGKFLLTNCPDFDNDDDNDDNDNDELYTWDVSAIVKEAGLPSDIVDVIPRPAPKMKGAPRIPPGFFNDAIRDANLRTRQSQSHGPHNCLTPEPHQRTLSPFSSLWRLSKSHGATERNTKSPSRPLSWTRNLVSSVLRRRDGFDIQSREVEVPCTAGKPRNYHARKKPATRPPNTHTTLQPNAATQTPSSQHPPPTATASTLLAVPETSEATGTTSSPRVAIAGWRARFVGWLCCVPIQHTDGQH